MLPVNDVIVGGVVSGRIDTLVPEAICNCLPSLVSAIKVSELEDAEL